MIGLFSNEAFVRNKLDIFLHSEFILESTRWKDSFDKEFFFCGCFFLRTFRNNYFNFNDEIYNILSLSGTLLKYNIIDLLIQKLLLRDFYWVGTTTFFSVPLLMRVYWIWLDILDVFYVMVIFNEWCCVAMCCKSHDKMDSKYTIFQIFKSYE